MIVANEINEAFCASAFPFRIFVATLPHSSRNVSFEHGYQLIKTTLLCCIDQVVVIMRPFFRNNMYCWRVMTNADFLAIAHPATKGRYLVAFIKLWIEKIQPPDECWQMVNALICIWSMSYHNIGRALQSTRINLNQGLVENKSR
jgi:hypothetical protein